MSAAADSNAEMPSDDPGNAIDTSIILATCTRSAMLRVALASLITQTWSPQKPLEIIVVDDASTDDTPAVLAEFQHLSPIPFTILQGHGQGVAAARNLGAAHARGTWLASFDDDQIALPNWLQELRRLADSTRSSCIGGALALQLPEGHTLADFGPRARRILGEHLFGELPTRYDGGSMHPATNNVLIRRDLFTSLGGYDTTFTEGGEDKDLFTRAAAAGHTMWYQPYSPALHIMTPQRLSRANLHWTSLRIGACDARVYQRKQPRVAPLKLAAKRLAVTLLRDLPQLLAARFRNDHTTQLDLQCSLWYTEGLLRALPAILGNHPERSRFLRSIDFRTRNGERPTSS